MSFIDALTAEEKMAYNCYRQKIRIGNGHLVTESERAANTHYRQLERVSRGIRQKYENLRTSAYNRGLEFSVTWERFKMLCLTTPHCPISGEPLDYGYYPRKGTKPNNLATVDRINSSLGYTDDNIWIISFRANRLKSNATIDELEAIVLALKAREELCNLSKVI